MEIGNKIKQLRYKTGMTQELLAKELNVSAQSVSKWENGVSMPDISLLPAIAERFGVTIDDLFDLTNEQRLNRIENRLDTEKELPQDIFAEFEDFLKNRLTDKHNGKRATELLAYLYWHRMDLYSKKAAKYAKEAIRNEPGKKKCQWILDKAAGNSQWDWNLSNHTAAIDFYRSLVEENPDIPLPYFYLLDNLIEDHRADEAEKYLEKFEKFKNNFTIPVYRAYIALSRFDEKTADSIIQKLVDENPNDSGALFEAAQYYAKKADYSKVIEYYERSFENEPEKPRFIDALQGISDVYKILGNYEMAAKTYERVIDCLKNEWKLTEETELKEAIQEKERLDKLAKEKRP